MFKFFVYMDVLWECKYVFFFVFDDDIVFFFCFWDLFDIGLYVVVFDYCKLNYGYIFVILKLINKNFGVVWWCIDL